MAVMSCDITVMLWLRLCNCGDVEMFWSIGTVLLQASRNCMSKTFIQTRFRKLLMNMKLFRLMKNTISLACWISRDAACGCQRQGWWDKQATGPSILGWVDGWCCHNKWLWCQWLVCHHTLICLADSVGTRLTGAEWHWETSWARSDTRCYTFGFCHTSFEISGACICHSIWYTVTIVDLSFSLFLGRHC